jgi:hypothetical protein
MGAKRMRKYGILNIDWDKRILNIEEVKKQKRYIEIITEKELKEIFVLMSISQTQSIIR